MEEIELLNSKQREAVISSNNKILVMAGAGTGKTRVLTTRIKYLLDNGVEPEFICAFTFTNKAANEMSVRLMKMTHSDKFALPSLQTFHSFCYSFIRDPMIYMKLGFNNQPTLITDTEKSKVIKNILDNHNLKNFSNVPFYKAISKIKNRVKFHMIRETDKMVLNMVYQEYQRFLIGSSMIDFDDMIPLFLKYLSIDDDFRDNIQFKYVLVDECQDTNQIQYDLIKSISSKYHNVFMVGDEDQLIYSFRNSDIDILKDFKNQADEVIILDKNYRSNTDILEHANNLIDYNKNRLKKNLYSDNVDLNKVIYKEFETMNDEAVAVAEKIKELIQSGISPNEIAVLYRNNSASYPFEDALNRLDIPYQIIGQKPLYEHTEVRLVINAYRLFLNHNNLLALNMIYKNIKNITDAEYNKFLYDYTHSERKDLFSFLMTYGYNQKIQDLGYRLNILDELFKTGTNEEFYMNLLEYLHLTKFMEIKNDESDNKKIYKNEFIRLTYLKDQVKDLSKDELGDFFNKLILIDDKEKNEVKPMISLLTIHKAKGLEFRVVFIIGFNEGIIPGIDSRKEAIEEERRLAYVAITRAKERLFISSSIEHQVNGQRLKLQPSRFLLESGINQKSEFNYKTDYWYNH